MKDKFKLYLGDCMDVMRDHQRGARRTGQTQGCSSVVFEGDDTCAT